MNVKVFFSWQSDTPVDRGKGLIERALVVAAGSVAAAASIGHQPEID